MSLPDPNSTNFMITEYFGISAGDSYITLPIPVPDQTGTTPNAASFATGFPVSTMTAEASGGLPPFGQDFQGLLAMITGNIAAVSAGAFPQFSATRASAIGGYPVGAIVSMAANSGFWINVTAANSNNPDTSGANASGWYPLSAKGEEVVALSSGTVTLTAAQAACPLLAFNGTLTGNVTVIFPEWVGNAWTVAAYTAGAFSITLQTAVGANSVTLVSAGVGGGYTNAQNVFVDNGGNLWSNNVSTAGLAPLASPAFTGTPTTPNIANAFTSNTQIPNTAFVQNAINAAIVANDLASLASPIFVGNPTAPTQAPGTDNALLATTAFVQAAVTGIPKIKTGTFTCANGVVSVAFGVTLSAIPRVFVQWNYANPTVGWVVPSSISTTGFQYQSGNAGLCMYEAIVGAG